MTTGDHNQEPFARPSMALAMAVVMISSFGWNVIEAYGPRLPLALIGTVYLAISTLGWVWAERRGPRVLAIWLVVLVALGIVALWISNLGVFLIVMPSIGLAVVYGSIRWGIAVSVVFLVNAVLFNWHLGATPVQIYSSSTGFIPGAVFVIAAGQLIVRERAARQQVRRYAVQVEDLATTRERNRIAREIHDSVGHYLTVVNVQIEAARATLATDPAAATECLARAQDLARDGLSELRRSVTMLRGSAVDQRPFGVALSALVDESRARGLDTSLEILGTPQALTPAVEFTLFRAAQEAFTNVARHANATRVRCTLRYEPSDVSLAVADDGVGAVSSTPDGGFGLVGLRERAQLVGGTVNVQTSAGRGFTLEVQIPT